MTKSLLLHVGDDGKPVNFNLKKLKRSHLLITGASGSGKSYFDRVIAEQIVGRMQTFVIDPEGEYVTLREKFNFLLVGEGGEVPIHPRTAGVLAERLMKLGVSAIFDLSSMEVADQHPLGKEFCSCADEDQQADILQVLADAYPEPMEKSAIAEKVAVSNTSGQFGNNLGALRSAGMISYPSVGSARLESWVMLEE